VTPGPTLQSGMVTCTHESRHGGLISIGAENHRAQKTQDVCDWESMEVWKPAAPCVSEIPDWSWREGKEPLPMELLTESGAPRTDDVRRDVLPPLPSMGAGQVVVSQPCLSPQEQKPTEEEDTPVPPTPASQRPRSYRRPVTGCAWDVGIGSAVARPTPKAKSSPAGSAIKARTLSTPPKKGHRGVCSRPTTAGEESDSICSTSQQSASTYSVSWREEWNAGAEPFRHYPPLPPMPTSTALPPKGSPSKYVPQPSPKVPDPPPISKAQVTSSAPFVDDATLDQIDEEVNLKASTPPLSCNKQDGLIASRRRPGWQTASAPELPRVPALITPASNKRASVGSAAQPDPLWTPSNSVEPKLHKKGFSELARAFATMDVAL